MDRRQFLTLVGVGTLASNLPVVIAACSKGTSNAGGASQTPRADGFLEVGTVEKLTQDGQILNRKEKIIVVRNPATKNLVANNPLCPHQGCTVKWKADDGKFVCPCHGSKFTPEGKVLNGPANSSLGNYEVKEEKSAVLVKVVK